MAETVELEDFDLLFSFKCPKCDYLKRRSLPETCHQAMPNAACVRLFSESRV